MDLQELKNTIAVIESTERNIKGWENLMGRELAIIPTDSEYYKEFQFYIDEKRPSYDGKENPSPTYISSIDSKKVCQLLIDGHNEFQKPHKEKLIPFLTLKTD